MRKLLLLATLALPAAPALADITTTTDRGGSVVHSRDCARGSGQAGCTIQTDVTGANGNTASKTRVRTVTPGLARTEVTVTGPEGETRQRGRTTTWGN
jgi:hypothetical protein